MLQAVVFGAVVTALFALVPGIVWFSTRSRREAVESAKGLGWVWLFLFAIPTAIGLIVAAFSQLLQG
ncbi:MAG TPA: hypothetical protein VIP05_17440 [Burkholderiaceae bacterium]